MMSVFLLMMSDLRLFGTLVASTICGDQEAVSESEAVLECESAGDESFSKGCAESDSLWAMPKGPDAGKAALLSGVWTRVVSL